MNLKQNADATVVELLFASPFAAEHTPEALHGVCHSGFAAVGAGLGLHSFSAPGWTDEWLFAPVAFVARLLAHQHDRRVG